MRFSSLAEWLGWLEQSHPKEIDLGLERIRSVAQRLGLLKPTAKVITVAGTNGKGSCVTACAGLLRAASFSVGVYTSPHLLKYSERIQVNGEPVTDDLICAAFEKIADASLLNDKESAPVSLTYFEYGTLAALQIFSELEVDCMVLEVGLGGRLDAVNILDADVAIITSIALDHQDWLGDTRELIGREKAGILRLEQKFVCADENPPLSLFDIANQLKTRSYFIGRDFSYTTQHDKWQWRGKNLQGGEIALPESLAPHLPLQSMAAALQAVHLLDVKLSAEDVQAALNNLSLPGRFQKIVYRQREFILDVAHNPAATEYFARRLAADPARGKTCAIVAMMSDKDRLASLANLTNVVDAWYVLMLNDVPRAATVEALTENLSQLQATVTASGDVNALTDLIISSTDESDRVLVFGSFFTVATVLSYMQTHDGNPSDSRGIE